MDLVKSCLLRVIAKKRFVQRLKTFREGLVMAAVARERDQRIADLTVGESARLDALASELKKAEAAARGNAWLSESDVAHTLALRKHVFELTRPPPIRHVDPARVDTYVMPEHYELLEASNAGLHLLLLSADEVLHVFQFVARVYGTAPQLWALNLWRAVEALRAEEPDIPLFAHSFKSRALAIVEKHLAPGCVNPVHVPEATKRRAVEAGNGLAKLGPLKRGAFRKAAYGAVIAALWEAQHEAFRVLLKEVAPLFFASDLGRAYLKQVCVCVCMHVVVCDCVCLASRLGSCRPSPLTPSVVSALR